MCCVKVELVVYCGHMKFDERTITHALPYQIRCTSQPTACWSSKNNDPHTTNPSQPTAYTVARNRLSTIYWTGPIKSRGATAIEAAAARSSHEVGDLRGQRVVAAGCAVLINLAHAHRVGISWDLHPILLKVVVPILLPAVKLLAGIGGARIVQLPNSARARYVSVGLLVAFRFGAHG